MSDTTTTARKAAKRGRIAPIKNREELAAVAMATAEALLERDKAIITRDQRLAAIGDDFNPLIESYEKPIEENIQRMKLWSTAHRAEAFGKEQSIKVCGHVLAFRKGSGAVDFDAGVKAADALEGLLAIEDEATHAELAEELQIPAVLIAENAERWIDDFSKVTVSLDKNRILRVFREGPEPARKFLESIGIRMVVKEEFHFTPNREEIAPAAVSGGKGES
jgi:hypothetical protein